MSRATTMQILGRPPVHPFPARMAPDLALQALEGIRPGTIVLDPMAGSGTVLAVARSKRARAIGFDVDPLAVLLARVWTSTVDRQRVREEAQEALVRATESAQTLSRSASYPAGSDEETRAFVRYWFDDRARRQLTALASSLATVTPAARDVLWCAFSRLIIVKQSGVSLAIDLSHSRPHKVFTRAPNNPFNLFETAVERVLDGCIDHNSRRRGPTSRVELGDARKLPLDAESVDIVFTSPPYLNAIDYLRCSKFSLVWMGYSIAELRQIRKTAIGTEVGASRDSEFNGLPRPLRRSLAVDSRFSAIIMRYVLDLRSTLGEVRRVLRPRGRAIFVVGENTVRNTFVPTGRLLSLVARECRLRLVARRSRDLPTNRRYLPPPGIGGQQFDTRIRREVVLAFAVEG